MPYTTRRGEHASTGQVVDRKARQGKDCDAVPTPAHVTNPVCPNTGLWFVEFYEHDEHGQRKTTEAEGAQICTKHLKRMGKNENFEIISTARQDHGNKR